MTAAEILTTLAIGLTSGIAGYLLRTRTEQQIADTAYRAGYQRALAQRQHEQQTTTQILKP